MDLKTLTSLRGISGFEQAVRRELMQAAAPLCQRVSLDKMGNVVAFKQGSDPQNHPHVVLAAHMDEVGFIVMSATKDGLLRVRPVGGIDPRVVISKRVLCGESAIPGVIGATAIHLQTADDRKRVLDYDSLYVDIGAKNKDEASEVCPDGCMITFDTPYITFGDGFVYAKALDDRVGCLTMLKVLEEQYPGDVTCLFTSEEEVGCRGALGGAFMSKADIAIILEGTTCNDLGDIPEPGRVCEAGKGVAISFMDNASIAHMPLFKQMLAIAKEEGIPHQIKQSVTGGNDSGAFQREGNGKRTLVLSVPCRYIHSPSSVVKYSDTLSQIALVKAYLHRAAM